MMNNRAELTPNKWHSRSKKKHSLQYSRHMLHSATTHYTLAEKRLSKTISDSDVTEYGRQAGGDSYIAFKRRQCLGRMKPEQQTSLPNTFHLKCNENMLQTHTLMTSPVMNKISFGVDEDARSFCDSVSSMACSNLTTADSTVPVRGKENDFRESISKFHAIKKWLQELPTPV